MRRIITIRIPDECPKKFRDKFNLDRHKKTHSDEKKFKCDLCEATFKGEPELNRHKGTHTGERCFECECGSIFHRMDLLKNHKKSCGHN